MAHGQHRFGQFEVRADQRLLLADGCPVELGSRAYDLLVALIEHRDRVMTKSELLDLVWPGLIVEENNLATQVSTLRKRLGAGVIATVPGRGYRFTAELADALPSDVKEPALRNGCAFAPTECGLTNIPVELPSLYGRQDDIEAVRALVEAHRLVTIVGAGGIGKTRLALAAAHGLREGHPDGVWIVDLAPLADAAMLWDAVAHALRLTLPGHRAPCDELVAALGTMRLLLVLDSCEHLTEAAARLSRSVLDRARGVRLLVTSQAPLALEEERRFRLEPLAVPQERDEGRALDHGAIELFVERVKALDRRFALGARMVRHVIDICRQLDGLPLAIELAAARVPLLGVQGVRDRLGMRFQLLNSTSRNRPRRHQTLRATLDWSHELLADDEKVVLRRLSVFSGGCTVEAGQRVASGDDVGESLVLEILGSLIDKSWVVADGSDRPRLRLLESVRIYAFERLREAGEVASSQERHAEYFRSVFTAWADALYAGAMTEAQFTAARSSEVDNLREAINHSLHSQGDIRVALDLLAAAAPLCHLLPLRAQGARWWSDLSRRIDLRAASEQTALCRHVWIHWGQGFWWTVPDWPMWPPLAPASLGSGDARRQGHALCVLALKASDTGDFPAAYAALGEAASIERPEWPAWLRMRRAFLSAILDRETGERVSAPEVMTAALGELEAAGESDGCLAFLIRTDLAAGCIIRGETDEAAARLRALTQRGREQWQNSMLMCPATVCLMLALMEKECLDEAAAVATEAARHLHRADLWPKYGCAFALLAAKRGHLMTAARMIGAVEARMAHSGSRWPRAMRRLSERAMSILEDAHSRSQVIAWLSEGGLLQQDAFSLDVIAEVSAKGHAVP